MDQSRGIRPTNRFVGYLIPAAFFASVLVFLVGQRLPWWQTAHKPYQAKSVAMLERAHAPDAHHPDVQALLSQAYRAQGQPDKALELLKTTARNYPRLAWPHLLLGEWYESQDDHQRAVAQYRLAADADPTSAQAGDDDGVGHYVTDDLFDRLDHSKTVYDGTLVKRTIFNIDSRHQRVVFQHPVSRIEYTILISPGSRLAFSSALAPEVWRPDKGDGVQFGVYIAHQGTEWQLFSQYIDPKNIPSDRRWHDHEIALAAWAGQLVTLTFVTGPGPDGDDRYDWAGWGTPRIITSLDTIHR